MKIILVTHVQSEFSTTSNFFLLNKLFTSYGLRGMLYQIECVNIGVLHNSRAALFGRII